jgi:methionine sulfoxide reductase catalytic subunit
VEEAMDNYSYRAVKIKPSEITPESVYLSRRNFLKSAGLLGLGAVLASACSPRSTANPELVEPGIDPKPISTSANADEMGNPLNSYEEITNYNNFYEFTVHKERVAEMARGFRTSPWQVEVSGLVHKPKTFGLDDLLSNFDQEERIYRLRCVEGWSMVIPWMGFPIWKLLELAEPMADAKFVKFVTLLDVEQMPGQKSRFYPWPYTEGLRIDEAMHDLAILATGLYGKDLPAQNGAPVRLVVPWKYGFKSIKSIVKIELLEYAPQTLWSEVAPNEYGFYANVNPQVDHPRWSQKTERRIGELGRRETLMFNGYAEQVAHLYDGMDLQRNY